MNIRNEIKAQIIRVRMTMRQVEETLITTSPAFLAGKEPREVRDFLNMRWNF